jgi:hypothetical protein
MEALNASLSLYNYIIRLINREERRLVVKVLNRIMLEWSMVAHTIQKIHSGSEFTFLKAAAAHLSRMFLVSRHLFSS